METAANQGANNASSDWDSLVDPNKKKASTGNKEDGLFWRLKPREQPYRFRIVDKPLFFRSHFKAFETVHRGKNVISPASTLEQAHLDPAWSQGGWEPERKYACVVIDRDNGRVRILETGPGVFKHIINYCRMSGKKVYDRVASDWCVEVTKTNTKTEYNVSRMDPESLTDAEIKMLEQFNYDWRSNYKPWTTQQIADLWNKVDPDLRINKNPKSTGKSKLAVLGDSVASTAPSQTVAAAAPAAAPAVAPAVAPAAAAVTAQPASAAPAAPAAAPAAAKPAPPAAVAAPQSEEGAGADDDSDVF